MAADLGVKPVLAAELAPDDEVAAREHGLVHALLRDLALLHRDPDMAGDALMFVGGPEMTKH